MNFKMKFEALQPIGYGDYESGLAEGRKQGIEQGKFLGVQEGVAQTNADVLVLTGTEKTTATKAIEEINATLATNLTAKGVEADATETTYALADKVGDIKDPQDAYDEGYNVGFEEGKAQGDTLAEFFGKWCDYEIKEITIGANNVTNGGEIVEFLWEATGGYSYIILLDEPTTQYQFVAHLRKMENDTAYRYVDNIVKDGGWMGSPGYGFSIVEGTRYRYIVIKGVKN